MSRNNELIEAFATELRVRRKNAKLSQEELARLADVNRTYIAKLELEKNQPTLSVLHDLAHALGCNLPELIKGVLERYKEKHDQLSAINILRQACTPPAADTKDGA